MDGSMSIVGNTLARSAIYFQVLIGSGIAVSNNVFFDADIDIISSPEAVDLKQLTGYTLVFVAFEIYRDNEAFFRMLPESVQDRITILSRPADFPSVAPEIKCACYCSELKALLPREEAQLFDHHTESAKPR